MGSINKEKQNWIEYQARYGAFRLFIFLLLWSRKTKTPRFRLYIHAQKHFCLRINQRSTIQSHPPPSKCSRCRAISFQLAVGVAAANDKEGDIPQLAPRTEVLACFVGGGVVVFGDESINQSISRSVVHFKGRTRRCLVIHPVHIGYQGRWSCLRIRPNTSSAHAHTPNPIYKRTQEDHDGDAGQVEDPPQARAREGLFV